MIPLDRDEGNKALDTGRPRFATFMIAALAGFIAVAATAWACEPQSTLQVAPATARAGEQLRVTGTSWLPQSAVPVDLVGSDVRVRLGEARADAGGSFLLVTTLPQVPPGRYYLEGRAEGEAGVYKSVAVFEVTPTPEPSPTAGATTPSPEASSVAGAAQPGEIETAEGTGATGTEVPSPAPSPSSALAPARTPTPARAAAAAAASPNSPASPDEAGSGIPPAPLLGLPGAGAGPVAGAAVPPPPNMAPSVRPAALRRAAPPRWYPAVASGVGLLVVAGLMGAWVARRRAG